MSQGAVEVSKDIAVRNARCCSHASGRTSSPSTLLMALAPGRPAHQVRSVQIARRGISPAGRWALATSRQHSDPTTLVCLVWVWQGKCVAKSWRMCPQRSAMCVRAIAEFLADASTTCLIVRYYLRLRDRQLGRSRVWPRDRACSTLSITRRLRNASAEFDPPIKSAPPWRLAATSFIISNSTLLNSSTIFRFANRPRCLAVGSRSERIATNDRNLVSGFGCRSRRVRESLSDPGNQAIGGSGPSNGSYNILAVIGAFAQHINDFPMSEQSVLDRTIDKRPIFGV